MKHKPGADVASETDLINLDCVRSLVQSVETHRTGNRFALSALDRGPGGACRVHVRGDASPLQASMIAETALIFAINRCVTNEGGLDPEHEALDRALKALRAA
jgi:hypothetical protein